MRIKSKQLYKLKKKILVTDDEGGKYSSYSDELIDIQANIYPATGKLQAEIYGERLNYIMNMLYDGDIDIVEGDAVIYKNTDYKVISIKQYSKHKLIEVERI